MQTQPGTNQGIDQVAIPEPLGSFGRNVVPARLAAARRNGQRSRGPITAAGKKIARNNALKHGLRAESLIVPGLETPEAWEAHLNATLEAVAPCDYVEAILAQRIAWRSWQLQRCARAQTAIAASQQEGTFEEVCESRAREQKYAGSSYLETAKRRRKLQRDPEEHRRTARQDHEMIDLLRALPNLEANTPIDSLTAENLVSFLSHHSGVDLKEDLGFTEAEWPEHWTANTVRAYVDKILASEHASPDARESFIHAFTGRAQDEEAYAAEVDQAVSNLRERRILDVDAARAELLERYEGTIERALYRAVAEVRAYRDAAPIDVTPTG